MCLPRRVDRRELAGMCHVSQDSSQHVDENCYVTNCPVPVTRQYEITRYISHEYCIVYHWHKLVQA